MRALSPVAALWRTRCTELALGWYRWALAELSGRDPCHADIPYIVHRIRELEATQ